MSPRLQKAFDKYKAEYEAKSGFPVSSEDAFEFGYMLAVEAAAVAYNSKLQNSAIEEATDTLIAAWNEGPLT